MYVGYEYCPIYKGVAFLNNVTATEWRGIPRLALSPSMCVSTILPANTILAKSYPIFAQPGYVPKNLISGTSVPDRLYAYLRTDAKQALKVMPTVKYSLEGVEIKMKSIFPWRELGVYVVEGIARLIGDIVIKPSERMYPIYLSVDARNGNILVHQAIQVRNDFITSLKINHFIPEEDSSLSISNTLNDKTLMAATSVQLMREGNSQKITATFIPEYCEIETRFGLTLEVQMGCEFTGKVTFYPKSSIVLDKLEHALHSFVNIGENLTQALASNVDTSVVSQGFLFMTGTIILCVLVAA